MSEAITKACDDCDGTGRDRHDFTRTKCVECDGTGRVPDVEATLRAEVARLTAELDEANFARATMIEGCDSLGNRLTAAKAEIARLTAEVERLKGREAFARPFVERNDVDSDGDETCPECGNYVRFTSGSEHECPPTCPRAAWIAGCKS